MAHFKGIQNLEDLKSQYRKLAFENHPDMGGLEETMKEINGEYDVLFPIWQRKHNTISNVKNNETASETRSEFYTQNGWKGKNYNSKLSTKEISALIREYVKQAYPLHKFSVTCEYFAGGSSIHVALMEAPHEIFKDNKAPKNGYIQRASYYFKVNKTPNDPNPYELTEQTIEILKDVNNFMKSYNYSDCDGMIDYFDVNFWDHLDIGKWNKPFKVVEKTLRIKNQKPELVKC